MTNPTRQEILEAHEALEKLCQRLPATRAAKETILRALPPLPRPTMAEIEWDEGEHFLAEAENRAWGKVIMLFKKAKTGKILSLFHEDGEQCFVCLDPCDLAPTGRRYVLQEGE